MMNDAIGVISAINIARHARMQPLSAVRCPLPSLKTKGARQ